MLHRICARWWECVQILFCCFGDQLWFCHYIFWPVCPHCAYLSIYQTNGSLLYALQNKERLSEDEGYKRVFDDDNEERALKEPKRKVKYSVCYSYSNHWEFFVSYLFNAIRCFCWFAVLLFHLVVLCCLLVTWKRKNSYSENRESQIFHSDFRFLFLRSGKQQGWVRKPLNSYIVRPSGLLEVQLNYF